MSSKISQTKLLSFVAIGLSILALGVSVIEVSFLRDEVKAQAWPFIQLSTRYSEKGYEISIQNKGVGPARIRTSSMFLDGEPSKDLDTAILQTLGENDAFSYNLYRSYNPAPGVMSSGEQAVIFGVPWQENTRRLSQEWSERFSIAVCYCSIFDECWITVLDRGEPEETKSCD